MRFLIHPPSSDSFGMTGNFFVVKGRRGEAEESPDSVTLTNPLANSMICKFVTILKIHYIYCLCRIFLMLSALLRAKQNFIIYNCVILKAKI
jgi:hypothetical protein